MSDMITTLAFYMRFPFVRYALIVGVLIALCSSLLGVTLVLKRFSYIGDGLSHVAFGAMAVAAVLNLTNDTLLVMPVTVVAAILLLRTGQNTKIHGDAAIAMLSVGAGHSGAAHRRVGRIKDAYRIAVFPQPPDLVFLADDLKEFLRFLGRYREGTEGCVIVLPALDPAACGEEPVFILLSQRESIHRIACHAIVGGMERDDIIDRVFPASSTAEQRGYRKNSRHYYHRPQ